MQLSTGEGGVHPGPFANPLQGHIMRQTNIHTHLHTYGQFIVSDQPTLLSSMFWAVGKNVTVPGHNPCTHGENMQTPALTMSLPNTFLSQSVVQAFPAHDRMVSKLRDFTASWVSNHTIIIDFTVNHISKHIL